MDGDDEGTKNNGGGKTVRVSGFPWQNGFDGLRLVFFFYVCEAVEGESSHTVDSLKIA